jgi:predicted DNA-binding protein (MmcQ/YjbR family)
MNRNELVAYCLSKHGTEEDFPFGDEVSVFKIMGKVFALIPIGEPLQVSLKCDPTLAIMLRETYPGVTPGYHLNKRHWNTILVDESIPNDEIYEWVDHSYELVVKGLTRAQRKLIEEST